MIYKMDKRIHESSNTFIVIWKLLTSTKFGIGGAKIPPAARPAPNRRRLRFKAVIKSIPRESLRALAIIPHRRRIKPKNTIKSYCSMVSVRKSWSVSECDVYSRLVCRYEGAGSLAWAFAEPSTSDGSNSHVNLYCKSIMPYFLV